MAMFQSIYKAFSDISLLQWALVTILWIIATVGVSYSFVHWFFRRQWRFFKNLRRPIVILEPRQSSGDLVPGGSMASEIEIIKENGFLNVDRQPTDSRRFNPAGKHCIVVLGYKPGMIGLDDILIRIKSNHVPLIVYSYGSNSITGDDKAKFDTYQLTLYANFPLTLLNHIFATVASYPYDPK